MDINLQEDLKPLRKPRTNKRLKYIVSLEENDTTIFSKKYKTANDITQDFQLLTKDKVSDILRGRYKGMKRDSKNFFNKVKIERINELI